MYTASSPFRIADAEDIHFRQLLNNRADNFWKLHSRHRPADFFSPEFKDLITHMLQPIPEMRLTLADIIGHPWLSEGGVASQYQVHLEFHQRLETNRRLAQEEYNKALACGGDHVCKQHHVHRGVEFNSVLYLSEGDQVPENAEMAQIVYLKTNEYTERHRQVIKTTHTVNVLFPVVLDAIHEVVGLE